MSVPDCLLNPAMGYLIAGLCIVVFVYYCRIASAWLSAAKRYNVNGLRNPWLVQAIIFVACGVCGYLTIPLSLLSIAWAAWVKLIMLLVITVSSELFLKNFALDSIRVAKHANVGQSMMVLNDRIKQGKISKDHALKLLRQEYEGLQVILAGLEDQGITLESSEEEA